MYISDDGVDAVPRRSVDWVYNSRMACWVASVGVQGIFRLTREEVVNNTVVRSTG